MTVDKPQREYWIMIDYGAEGWKVSALVHDFPAAVNEYWKAVKIACGFSVEIFERVPLEIKDGRE